jgi:hypothetical protein
MPHGIALDVVVGVVMAFCLLAIIANNRKDKQ